MDELIGAAEAARRAGVSKEWIIKLCQQARISGARKIGNQWVIPAGAKVLPPVAIGRPLRTLEIPRHQHAGAGPGYQHKPAPAKAGEAGPRAGKKGAKK